MRSFSFYVNRVDQHILANLLPSVELEMGNLGGMHYASYFCIRPVIVSPTLGPPRIKNSHIEACGF